MIANTGRYLLQGGLMLVGTLIVGTVGGKARRATAEDQTVSGPALLREMRNLSQTLESTRGELAVARLQLARAEAVMEYSSGYAIPADLAGAIYDISLAEGVDPGLAFRLVKVESRFDTKARSRAGAIGLTQVLPNTARLYEPGLSLAQLYDRDTNLRLGLRYLRDLLERYDGDIERALLAYNRGPAKVKELIDSGTDPRNGYSKAVMRGYRP